ncbi:hypothetical protein BJ742DRAFT_858652 [Cladochytrium replicatum]|nr:hypothetical protein BJ742DRAFT_858652 [Cladochytrium replicatum]
MFGPGVPPATSTGPGSTLPAGGEGGSGVTSLGDQGMPGGIIAAIVVSVVVEATAMAVSVFMWIKCNKKKRQFQTLEMIQMHNAELPPPYENNNTRNLPQQQSSPQQRYSFVSALFTPSDPSVVSESHSHSSTSNSNHTAPSSEQVRLPQTEDAFGLALRTSSRSNSVPVVQRQQQRSSMISVGSETSWVSDGMVFAAIGTSQAGAGVGVARVVATHKPFLDDEIAIREGELVDVIRFFDDGWALGRSSVTGQRGFFPMSLVRIVETKDGREAGKLLGGGDEEESR